MHHSSRHRRPSRRAAINAMAGSQFRSNRMVSSSLASSATSSLQRPRHRSPRRRPPRRRRRRGAAEALGQLAHGAGHLVEAALVQPDREEVPTEESLGVGLAGLDAEVVRVRGQPLGVVEAPGDAGPAGQAQLGVPHRGGLAKGGGCLFHPGQQAIGQLQLAAFHGRLAVERHGAEELPRPLRADQLANGVELRAQLQPFADLVRTPQRHEAQPTTVTTVAGSASYGRC